MIALRLVAEAVKRGERTLLFSHSIPTLNLLERVLARTPSPRPNAPAGATWQPDVDYLRIDGSTGAGTRPTCLELHRPEHAPLPTLPHLDARGRVGINLVAASRVVLFDCNWNPAHDLRAVNRSTDAARPSRCTCTGWSLKVRVACTTNRSSSCGWQGGWSTRSNWIRSSPGSSRSCGEPSAATATADPRRITVARQPKTHWLRRCSPRAPTSPSTWRRSPITTRPSLTPRRFWASARRMTHSTRSSRRAQRPRRPRGVHCSGCGCLRTGVVPWAGSRSSAREPSAARRRCCRRRHRFQAAVVLAAQFDARQLAAVRLHGEEDGY